MPIHLGNFSHLKMGQKGDGLAERDLIFSVPLPEHPAYAAILVGSTVGAFSRVSFSSLQAALLLLQETIHGRHFCVCYLITLHSLLNP